MENQTIKSYTNEELNEAHDAQKGLACDYFAGFAGGFLILIVGGYAVFPNARNLFQQSYEIIISAFMILSVFGILTATYSYFTLRSKKYQEKAKKRIGLFLGLTICIAILGYLIWPAMWNAFESIRK